MRTTVEIADEHRAKLLEIAARRGEKGFSGIVGEAIALYLKDARENEEKRKKAQRARGALSSTEAEELREEIAHVRKRWR
jgi:metal-responsive CopG/Arc/MetJ family transcriptional regulator